jgi:hypothetical protein
MVVSSLLPNCTDCLLCQSLQQLLATNQQAKATRQRASISTAEAMRQTTLTQCFNPPVADVAAIVPSTALGYGFLDVEGQQYLLNNATNHLILVPAGHPPPPPSEKAQSMSPINLAQNLYDVDDSLVTPSFH